MTVAPFRRLAALAVVAALAAGGLHGRVVGGPDPARRGADPAILGGALAAARQPGSRRPARGLPDERPAAAWPPMRRPP